MVNLIIADFIRDPLWDQARWEATTFGWDKRGAGPPYMGIVFGDAQAAKMLFGKWVAKHGNADRWEALRIAIIEGPLPQPAHPGPASSSAAPPTNSERGTLNPELPAPYFIHISCNPISLASDGEALSALFLAPKRGGQTPIPGTELGSDPAQLKLPSRICQANPLPVPPGQPTLLARFKEEYAKHRQFLLAPVIRRTKPGGQTPTPRTELGSDPAPPDGELRVDVNLGIIKRQIIFRRAADLNPADPLDIDAQALGLTTPPPGAGP